MLRILFAGTPEIAVQSLGALIAASGEPFGVVGVLTNPDRRAGRGSMLHPSPVKLRALEAGIPVLQPEKLDTAARSDVVRLNPDLLVVVAYGRIFGPRFLSLFPSGAINMHPSLLPRFRGPSPIQAAILAGDGETGVTVQYITEEMDAGPLLSQETYPLTGSETAENLTGELGLRGGAAVVAAVKKIAAGTAESREQDDSLATYCRLVGKTDGRVTWSESAVQLSRMIRAYTPWPGVSVGWNGRRIQLMEALPVPEDGDESAVAAEPGTVIGVDNRVGILLQTSNGILAVRTVKPQSRSVMDFASFLNGNSQFVGSVLDRI